MRIGMILDKTFPPDPRVENEAVSLIEAGHEVFLFCLTYGKEQKEEQMNKIYIKRYLSNKFEYKLSALVYTFNWYTILMRKKIKHFLKTYAIEVIHIHDIRIADAVFQGNKEFDLPTVLDLHENLPEIMKLYTHVQKFPGKLLISPKRWKQKEEFFIRKATKVITVTNESKKEVVNRTKVENDKICVVPNTVLSSFYSKFVLNNEIISKYKKDFVILYLGDTGLRRGLLTAIESVKVLLNEIENIKLVIVGENSTDVFLKKHVKELGINRFVDFEGWKDVSLFPSYIMSSNVCISPLHRNLHHDTTYANKLFQYMSFGKPILVSDATAQKKLINQVNSGLVHRERDVKDFADKILKIFKSKELSQSLGANGRAFIKNEFHWGKTSGKLIDLYNNLAN